MSDCSDSNQQTTVLNLKKHLESDFNLVCFEDLYELSKTHGGAFNQFEKYRKDEFDADERLVFYSSECPDQDLCDHIQRAASEIDISNFFILICTPFDLNEQLIQSNKKHGFDDQPMQCEIVDLKNTKPLVERSSSFLDTVCPMPFSYMNIAINGDSRPCCKLNHNCGTINSETTAHDVFYGSEFQNLRDQMLQGKKPTSCERCWKQEDKGSTSLRQLMVHKHLKKLNKEWIDNVQPRCIDLIPSYLCNFKCRICNREASSSVASEELKFAETKEQADIIKKDIDFRKNDFDFDTLCNSLNELDFVEYIHVMGGEPFMWRDLERFLDFMIDTGKASGCTLEFNTNGSVYPETVIQKIQEKFRFAHILISIDNVGNRFETERGGNWKNVNLNLEKYSRLVRNKFDVSLASTVNIQNLLYLNELESLAEQLSMSIVWTYLDNPTFFAIDNITSKMKQAVLDKYRNTNSQEMQKIYSRVYKTVTVESSEFIDFMDKLDQRRNKKFKNTHALVYKLMTPNLDLTKES